MFSEHEPVQPVLNFGVDLTPDQGPPPGEAWIQTNSPEMAGIILSARGNSSGERETYTIMGMPSMSVPTTDPGLPTANLPVPGVILVAAFLVAATLIFLSLRPSAS